MILDGPEPVRCSLVGALLSTYLDEIDALQSQLQSLQLVTDSGAQRHVQTRSLDERSLVSPYLIREAAIVRVAQSLKIHRVLADMLVRVHPRYAYLSHKSNALIDWLVLIPRPWPSWLSLTQQQSNAQTEMLSLQQLASGLVPTTPGTLMRTAVNSFRVRWTFSKVCTRGILIYI